LGQRYVQQTSGPSYEFKVTIAECGGVNRS